MTLLQSGSRNTDLENMCVDTGQGEAGGELEIADPHVHYRQEVDTGQGEARGELEIADRHVHYRQEVHSGQGGGGRGTGDCRPTRVLSTGSTESMTNESLPCGTGSSPQCSVGIQKEGNPKQRGYMCTYSWFSLLYSRN